METKNRGISESKARIEGGSAAATRPLTHPLSLSAGLYGPVLAIKGTASPRSAPWTAPGRAWGLAVYEGKGGTATGGASPPGRGCTKERFCNTPDPDGISRVSGLRNGIAVWIRLATGFRSIRKPEASKILLGEKQKEVRQLST